MTKINGLEELLSSHVELEEARRDILKIGEQVEADFTQLYHLLMALDDFSTNIRVKSDNYHINGCAGYPYIIEKGGCEVRISEIAYASSPLEVKILPKGDKIKIIICSELGGTWRPWSERCKKFKKPLSFFFEEYSKRYGSEGTETNMGYMKTLSELSPQILEALIKRFQDLTEGEKVLSALQRTNSRYFSEQIDLMGVLNQDPEAFLKIYENLPEEKQAEVYKRITEQISS